MNEFEKKNKELLEEIEKLKRKIQKIKERKKYGLVWEEEKDPEKIVLDCQYKIPILKAVKTKEVVTDKEKPMNILVEGENYHALSVLNYTHKGKIDVIYIDPPFNTGKKTWKYNNDYVDKEDEYKHSKWLNFMRNRLVVAKNLLKENGVLICAIDENENATLGLLLQQIFYNYKIDCVVVVHNPRGIQGNNFSYCHEYAYFVYPNDGKVYIEDQEREEHLVEELRDHGGNSLRKDARNCFYPFYVKGDKIIKIGDVPEDDFHPKGKNVKKGELTEIWPIDRKGIERKWVFAQDTVPEILDDLEVKEKKEGVLDVFRTKSHKKYRTVWIGPKYDASTYGSKVVKEITNTDFPFPKSIYTVKECLDAVARSNKNAVILDYFAGSGTTAHAVMEMNKLDKGNRTFIVCTNNENEICEEVTYPRIRNVIKGYKFEGNDKKILYEKELEASKIRVFDVIKQEIEKIQDKEKDNFDKIEVKIEDDKVYVYGIKEIDDKKEGLGGNLRYFKTDLLDIDHISHVTDEQRIKLTYQAGEMIALRENTFEEVEKNDWWQIFCNGKKHTAIYFKEDKSKLAELVKKLNKINHKIVLYVFSWGKNEYKNEFSEYKNIRVEDIPEPIIDVYKEVNRLG